MRPSIEPLFLRNGVRVVNRFVLFLALVVAMSAPATAQAAYGTGPDFRIPRVLGGEVDVNGGRVLGRGFSSALISTGAYQIVFNPDLFRGGCPVMTVTPTGMAEGNIIPIALVYQQTACSRTFFVYFWSPYFLKYVTTAFQFVAVGTSR
jgi:hypothetical protein